MRLIDADALKQSFNEEWFDYEAILYELDNAPTIDPAENGGCWGCKCALLGQASMDRIPKVILSSVYGVCGKDGIYDQNSTI